MHSKLERHLSYEQPTHTSNNNTDKKYIFQMISQNLILKGAFTNRSRGPYGV